jgi:transposase
VRPRRVAQVLLVWADGGYGGRLVIWARKVIKLTVTIVKRTDDMKGFVVLPRRWVVERTLGWITRTAAWSGTTNAGTTPTKP